MRLTFALTLAVAFLVACELPITSLEPEASFAVVYLPNGADAGQVPEDTATYKTGQLVTARANPGALTKKGFVFGGWNTLADGKGVTLSPGQSFAMGKQTVVLHAQWVAKTHTILFLANGGSGIMEPQTVVEGALTPLAANAFVRTGYVFKGWNTDAAEAGTGWADRTSVILGSTDLTLYAIWIPGQNTISFQPNGATGTMDNRTVASDSQTTLPFCSFSRTGYAFAGWTTLADGGGTPYADGSPLTMGTASVVLFAQWKPKTYQVGFDSNGGEGTMAPLSAPFGTEVTLSLGGFSKIGHNFLGWNTQSDGQGTNYAAGATVTLGSSHLMLYARWAVKNYTVTFVSNGSDGSMEVQSVPFGAGFTLSPLTFSKPGYRFDGWSLYQNGIGHRYTDEMAFTMGNQPLVLYAQWASNDYRVLFHANGGTGTMAPQTIRFDTTTTLTPENFTNGTLLFSGWAEVAGGPPVWADGASYTPGPSDKELYACWSSSVTIGWGPYATLAFTPSTATVGQGQTVTLAAGAGGTQWRWYVDNTLVTGQTGPTFSFSSATLGHHVVSVFTTVAGVGYSGTITISVNQ